MALFSLSVRLWCHPRYRAQLNTIERLQTQNSELEAQESAHASVAQELRSEAAEWKAAAASASAEDAVAQEVVQERGGIQEAALKAALSAAAERHMAELSAAEDALAAAESDLERRDQVVSLLEAQQRQESAKVETAEATARNQAQALQSECRSLQQEVQDLASERDASDRMTQQLRQAVRMLETAQMEADVPNNATSDADSRDPESATAVTELRVQNAALAEKNEGLQTKLRTVVQRYRALERKYRQLQDQKGGNATPSASP